jgi:hypothetical protein
MPILNSAYQPPFLFANPHLQLLQANIVHQVQGVNYFRERITTPDGDFLDLDRSSSGNRRCAILLHGLEGHSRRQYMLGMAKVFNKRKWDAVSFNFRGCSGQPNTKAHWYHAGLTGDLHCVVTHIIGQKTYDTIAIIGFSVGGNLTLKYLGEQGALIDKCVSCAAAVSVPCDLAASALQLAQPGNRRYMRRFLRMFHEKIRAKLPVMPGMLDDAGFESIRSFKEYDDRYTAPLNGFTSAEDYWRRASCKPFLDAVAIPTLIINAKDDPFLTPECSPVEEAKRNPRLYLETPDHGSHVGFVAFGNHGEYWHETRIAEWTEKNCGL